MRNFKKVSCSIAMGLAIAMTCTSVPFLPSSVATVQAAGMKLNRSSITMLDGTRAILYVSDGTPAVFSSSNEAVATVEQDGWITAKTAGTAVIKAVVSGQTLSCKVTVSSIPFATEIYSDNVIDIKIPSGWLVSKTTFDGQDAFNIRPKADASDLIAVNVMPIGSYKDMTPEQLTEAVKADLSKDSAYDGTAVKTGRIIHGNRSVYTASNQSQAVYFVRYGEKLITVKAYFKAEQDGSLTQPAAKYIAQTIKLEGVTVPVKVPVKQSEWKLKDSTVSIVLPDSSWKAIIQQDEFIEFASEKNTINILHISESQFKEVKADLIIPTTKEEMSKKLAKSFPNAVSTITAFENLTVDLAEDYHIYKVDFTQKLTDGTTVAYTEYGAYNDNEMYAVTGTVPGADGATLAAVKKSVESFQFLTSK